LSLVLLVVFTSLAAYRLWRLLAVDELPPLMWARFKLIGVIERRHGAYWAAGVKCPWCSGSWVAVGTVAVVWHYLSLPLPALWFAAVSVVVGALAQWLDD